MRSTPAAARPTVVLVRPPVSVAHKFSKPVECLALGYLASAVRAAGGDAVMLDGMMLGWTEEATARAVLEALPDVVGFTNVLNYFPESTTKICALLRDAGFGGPIIVGGHALSFFPDRILARVPAIDAVAIGEGEGSVADLVRAISRGHDWRGIPGFATRGQNGVDVRRPNRNTDLDHVHRPARDLVDQLIDHDGLVCISTSRGCYARCSFCSVPRFYGLSKEGTLRNGDWVARSASNTVAEIEFLADRFDLRELLFVDDEFFGGSSAGFARARQLADELAARRLRTTFALSCRAENVDEGLLTRLAEAGLRHVFVGVEAGTRSDLKLYGKGQTQDQARDAIGVIKRLGLSFQPGYMLFNHRTTISMIRENLRYLTSIGECKPVTINSSVEPHFGTPLALDMMRAGVVDDDGLALTYSYRDERVRLAKVITELAALVFQPFMETIAGLQSAITYEWRRSVPGRSQDAVETINRLEERVNEEFSDVVVRFVDQLADDECFDEAATLRDARQALSAVAHDLEVTQAACLLALACEEGDVRYWSQRDLMNPPGARRGP